MKICPIMSIKFEEVECKGEDCALWIIIGITRGGNQVGQCGLVEFKQGISDEEWRK